MKRYVLAIFMALTLSGCAHKPTQQEIDSADYGYSINQSDAQKQVQSFFSVYLKDPESARFAFSDVYKGYFVGSAFEGRKLSAGYLMDFRVNAKNSFGGYVGAKPYKALFHNGRLQGIWEIRNGNLHVRIM
ncbi:membrane lipoprotein lipid attachment site-containing protein [Ectopseudomonas oleovorans]|uniref:Lipoprotein n=1 Tax=Ectopseudomonas oleovorans TaxID=301 RepID=A0A3D9EUZ8_ECTOL|nr:membrane lipoprotein lipid attachment site-containing protein [Pseudomonas oleovorans]RED06993.1 hypothetical protein DFO60_1499 [Pseudomonas oleovorans]